MRPFCSTVPKARRSRDSVLPLLRRSYRTSGVLSCLDSVTTAHGITTSNGTQVADQNWWRKNCADFLPDRPRAAYAAFMAFEKGNTRMTSKSSTPQRLYLIEVATAAWSPAGMPIVCYLVQTSDGKNILIDSGLPENFVPPPGLPEAEYGKNLVEHRALPGVQPGNVDRLTETHSDPDQNR